MPDSVSTLALRVESQAAVSSLAAFDRAAGASGIASDGLKNKLLALSATFVSAKFGKRLIAEAAEGQEVFGKYTQVLGVYAKEADKTVAELRKSFNFSQTTAQKSLADMVHLFTNAGIQIGDALDYSSQLQKRAADIEAFTNAADGIEGVTQALKSGMLGISMPLKRLGIVLNEDTVNAQLAEFRIKGMTFATEDAALKAARFAIIMKQTATMQGQVSRESDNYANKLRKLRAASADLRNELGDVLIPAATALVGAATRVIQSLEATSPAAKTVVVSLGALAGASIMLGKPLAACFAGYKALTGALFGAAKTTVEETTATTAGTAAATANATATAATTTAKNLEAEARARNVLAIQAENAALSGQGKANLVSSFSGGAHHIPTLGRGAGKTLGQTAAKQGVGALGNAATASLGGTTAKTLGKSATGVFGRFGTALNKGVLKPLGKVAGVLGNVFTKVLRYVPMLGRFAGILGKALGFLGTGGAIIGGLIGILQIWKNAPKWLEAFIEDGWPRIKNFITSVGPKIYEGLKDIGIKIGTWIKDLVVGALQGLGSVWKRLLGFDTAAAQQYRIDKQIEDANERRQKLLETEEKQRKAEIAILESIEDAKKKQLRANANYAASKNDDETKLAQARAALTESEDKQKKNEEKRADIQAQIQKARDDQAANNEKRAALGVEKSLALQGASSIEERFKIKEEYKAKEAKLDETDNKIEEARVNAENAAKALAEEMGSLSETIAEQRQAVDDLTKTVEDSAQARDDDQKNYAKQREQGEKDRLAQARAERLESAKTHSERLAALQENVDAADAAVAEAEKATRDADTKNDRITAINGDLGNADVADAIGKLTNIATNVDDSVDAQSAYGNILSTLFENGYDISGRENFSIDNATALLESVNKSRADKDAERERLIKERDDAAEIGSQLASRQGESASARRALESETRAQNEALQARAEEDEKASADAYKKRRERARAFGNEMYQRQLNATTDTGARYGLVASKGLADWNDAQERLQATSEEIERLSDSIDEINEKERAGTATEDDLKRREKIESRRNELQSQFDSEYDSALSSRWSTEKELLSLQKTMADEQDKQIRSYVDEQSNALKTQLEAQAQAAEEENQRRLEERSEVEKEQRQAVAGAKAIAAGSSEAFNIQSKIYDRGQEELPPEKKIEKSTEKIEQYVSQMKEQLYNYLSGNASITLSMGY